MTCNSLTRLTVFEISAVKLSKFRPKILDLGVPFDVPPPPPKEGATCTIMQNFMPISVTVTTFHTTPWGNHYYSIGHCYPCPVHNYLVISIQNWPTSRLDNTALIQGNKHAVQTQSYSQYTPSLLLLSEHHVTIKILDPRTSLSSFVTRTIMSAKNHFDGWQVVYDFCISKVDSESVRLAYSLLELVFVRSGSFSVSKDFADTDIQTMIDALCTA